MPNKFGFTSSSCSSIGHTATTADVSGETMDGEREGGRHTLLQQRAPRSILSVRVCVFCNCIYPPPPIQHADEGGRDDRGFEGSRTMRNRPYPVLTIKCSRERERERQSEERGTPRTPHPPPRCHRLCNEDDKRHKERRRVASRAGHPHMSHRGRHGGRGGGPGATARGRRWGGA